MQVILLHGQGRTTIAMRLLGHRLHRLGYRVHYFRYYTGREKFLRIVERLVEMIRSLPNDEPYAFVGHSMGGVIARASLPALTKRKPVQLILLASPARAPRIGPLMRQNPIYKFFTYECGQLVTSTEFYASLPKLSVPTTVIAGTGGPRGSWFPLGDEPNDSVLTVKETQVNADITTILVPALHTFIMNSREALHHIDAILRHTA